MYSHGFYPLITKPTRKTSTSHTCIDNIFTNVYGKPITPGIFITDLSDHLPVFQLTTLDAKLHNVQMQYDNELFNSNVDHRELDRKLCCVNWSSVTNCDDVSKSHAFFMNTLKKLHDDCEYKDGKTTRVFKKTRKKETIRKPWITRGILKSINKKQRLYWKHTNDPSGNNERVYKCYRNKLNDIIRSSKQKYFMNLLERNKSDIYKTWQTINQVLGKHKTRKLPNHIEILGNRIEDEKEIADAFNYYFCNIGGNI